MNQPTVRFTLALRRLTALCGLFLALAVPARAAVIYDSNGFESPTFSAGNLNGQSQWTTIAGSASFDNIENTFVYAGQQALFVQNEPNVAQTIRQSFTTAVSGSFWQDFYIYPPATTDIASNLSVIGRGNAGTAFTLQFNSGLGLVLNGVSLTNKYVANSWNRITLNIDTDTDTVTMYLNGVLEPNGSGIAFTVSANNLFALDFTWKSKSTADANGGFYLDNYQVTTTAPIPEPAQASLFLTGIMLVGAGRLAQKKLRSSPAVGA